MLLEKRIKNGYKEEEYGKNRDSNIKLLKL